MADALKINTTLEVFNIYGNNRIGDVGAAWLFHWWNCQGQGLASAGHRWVLYTAQGRCRLMLREGRWFSSRRW